MRNGDVYEPSIGFVRTENFNNLSVGAEAIFDSVENGYKRKGG
jgi:hypothetical protein